LEQGFDLRHIAVSLIFNTDVPVITVSKRLDHAKPSTTIDIYGHLYPEGQEMAARIMDDVITPIEVQHPQSSQAHKSIPTP
jgi:integrase